MIILLVERGLVLVLATVALLLAIVSFRGLVNLQDPISDIGIIDQLSLLLGLHEQSHVLVVSTNNYTTDVHLFTFQKRLKDGAFFLSHESVAHRDSLLIQEMHQAKLQNRCEEVLEACDSVVPFTAKKSNIPILLGLPTASLRKKKEERMLVSGLHTCLSTSDYDYNKDGSIGMISPIKQIVMQWFALALLNKGLPFRRPKDTPFIAETDEDNLYITYATGDYNRLSNASLIMHQKVLVFGEIWDLVTVKIPGLGVYTSRQMVFTGGDLGREMITSPCVNPVVDRWWDYRGHNYHIKGIKKSVEEIKEKNGPFAGKKVARPVANFDDCHAVVQNYVKRHLGKEFDYLIKDIRKRKVYIRGNIFVKCSERGLTDPFKGGAVKMKQFMDSLKHACKVPNTEQPYACVDMMVMGVFMENVFGLHKSSVLYTPHKVEERHMTGDWQVTAALSVYQNGLIGF